MTLEEYRAAVLAGAKKELEKASWFSGVCMDDVNEFYPDVNEGVIHAIINTHYWDDPSFGHSGED